MEPRAAKPIYAGLFFTALATLAYELVLTRIFSVTVWYHFAFLAVSLAMFGMTAGALCIHVFPHFFSEDKTTKQLSLFASLLAISAPIAYLTHAAIPVILELNFVLSAVGLFAIFFNCFMLAIPFVFSGICVCLALTRYPAQVAKLYAVDLIGAAMACLLVVYELGQSDGPSTLLVAATLAGLAAMFFAYEHRQSIEMKLALVTFCILGLLTANNIAQFRQGEAAPFHLVWIKGELAPKPLYERWNSFSAVRVLGNLAHPYWPTGWGLNPKWVRGRVTGQIFEDIDGGAGTSITGFRGNLAEVDYLKCDVTNVAHYLIDNAKVLVIGVGGGRDILSALVFKQHDVLGVELNNSILQALTGAFGNFSGHLDREPNVRLVNDEARSYVSRSKEKFDFIQISLVDTWAATSAGAFALAENGLYTREGWDCFLDHLSERGILSVSRWYSDRNAAEIYRLISLACTALKAAGVNDPRAHLALVKYERPASQSDLAGIGTLIVSRAPLTQDQLVRLVAATTRLNFRIMLSPTSSEDTNLSDIADQKLPPAEIEAKFTSTISAPTDDCPYFFQLAKSPDFNNLPAWTQAFADNSQHMQGLVILAILSVVLSILLLLCVFLPLKLSSSTEQIKGSLPLCAYFLSIGMGFMFIEISQMQRLAIFLGNPSYGLSVVLFMMLTFTGLGSIVSDWMDKKKLLPSAAVRMMIVCAVIVAVGVLTPILLKTFMSADTTTRILVAMGVLAPLGLVAGTAFPTGMKMAFSRSRDLTAWLWGINGAASVLSSVLAVLASINFGITFSYYLACIWYGIAIWAAHINSKDELVRAK